MLEGTFTKAKGDQSKPLTLETAPMRHSARGEIPREQVMELAEKSFTPLQKLNAWDRRRVIQQIEHLNRLKPHAS
jgi:hypothetical protein